MTDDDDAKLVALIDNELDEDRRSALLARLAADEELRRRYDELREAGAPIAASLDTLLEQAPLARLRAMLPTDRPIRQPSGPLGGIALRELAAGIVIGLLAAGAAAWVALSFGLSGREDWRSAVVEYTNLYTNETFSPLNPDAALETTELSAVGARVGANLTPQKVALPDLRFTVAFMLSFRGSPFGRHRLRRLLRRAGFALHLRRSGTGRPDALGAPWRSVARLVVAKRTQQSHHWPHSRGAGRCPGANARKASLKSCHSNGRRSPTFEVVGRPTGAALPHPARDTATRGQECAFSTTHPLHGGKHANRRFYSSASEPGPKRHADLW
jgi:hypothetical protein